MSHVQLGFSFVTEDDGLADTRTPPFKASFCPVCKNTAFIENLKFLGHSKTCVGCGVEYDNQISEFGKEIGVT